MQTSGKAIWPWVLGLAVVGGAGAWLFSDSLRALADRVDVPVQAPATRITASPPAVTATPAAGAATTAPIRHPVDPRDAADPALPALADSDAAVREALGALFGQDRALALLLPDHLIQRVVTHIDNLDKPSVPAPAMAVRALPGSLQVETVDGTTYIAASNAERYAPYVAAFTALDAEAVGKAYVRFYPLLQQAYVQLGGPEAYFNDRLVAVIDHLVALPNAPQPVAVERDARGRYRFVDPSLQARSVGQKLLLRLDASQALAVKRQLRALRAAIARG
ncbi:DUF3014 domain-containing protein [Stenotrophomonas sp.]|uniref:DUF3014 domain-containing protein n=1 Tax=Stenotrophomonas sp. TaxID=69392 RepID=UPI002FC65588